MSAVTNSQIAGLQSPVLVYDGACGFCSRSVQFMLHHEQRHDLLFVTRESELGKQLRHTYGLDAVRSMLWIEQGHAFAESEAVIKAAAYLGGWWSGLATIGSVLPSSVLNAGYKVIAKNRQRISTKVTACLVPTPEQRNRFLA
jgi:predicted DCC family thiol-disulfide oxidoreductase YuxK